VPASRGPLSILFNFLLRRSDAVSVGTHRFQKQCHGTHYRP
jgi:hypothetical protein